MDWIIDAWTYSRSNIPCGKMKITKWEEFAKNFVGKIYSYNEE